jgi:hypothetical protein
VDREEGRLARGRRAPSEQAVIPLAWKLQVLISVRRELLERAFAMPLTCPSPLEVRPVGRPTPTGETDLGAAVGFPIFSLSRPATVGGDRNWSSN